MRARRREGAVVLPSQTNCPEVYSPRGGFATSCQPGPATPSISRGAQPHDRRLRWEASIPALAFPPGFPGRWGRTPRSRSGCHTPTGRHHADFFRLSTMRRDSAEGFSLSLARRAISGDGSKAASVHCAPKCQRWVSTTNSFRNLAACLRSPDNVSLQRKF